MKLTLLVVALLAVPSFAGTGTPQNHQCMKDGVVVEKTRKQCKKDGGTWEKIAPAKPSEHRELPGTPPPPPPAPPAPAPAPTK